MYLKILNEWTAATQRRFCDLIRWHSDGSISAVELDELDWLSRERKRLGYPISERERKSLTKIARMVRRLCAPKSHPLARCRRNGEVLLVVDPNPAWGWNGLPGLPGWEWDGLPDLARRIARFIEDWTGPKYLALFRSLPGSPLGSLVDLSKLEAKPRVHAALKRIDWDKRWEFSDLTDATEHHVLGFETVHLAGMATDVAIQHAALELASRGNRPVVHADLCGTMHGAAAQAGALSSMRRTIGVNQVVGVNMQLTGW